MLNDPGKRQIAPTLGIPVEAALVATAMALTLVALPIPSKTVPLVDDAMLLGFSGFLLFFISKVSLFSRGVWATWGPTPMTLPFKLTYFLGYLMMVISVAGLGLFS
jgi:hypothetical protein